MTVELKLHKLSDVRAVWYITTVSSDERQSGSNFDPVDEVFDTAERFQSFACCRKATDYIL